MKIGRVRVGHLFGVSAALLGFVTTDALAYGLWTAKRAGENVVVYGKGPADRAYTPDTITSTTVLDASGEVVPSHIEKHAKQVTINVGPRAAIFLVEGNMGIFSQNPKGYWIRGTKAEVPGANLTQQFFKYGLSITHLHGNLPELPAQKLQIVPLSNPAEAESGDLVKVRVLFNGEPLNGATLIPDYVNQPTIPLGKTDAAGEVELFVRNDGINVAAVVHMEKLSDDPKIDQIEHIATLSFPAHQPHSH